MIPTIIVTAIATFLATQFFHFYYEKKYGKPFDFFKLIGFKKY